jgi:lysophospholipase L1-like esterase
VIESRIREHWFLAPAQVSFRNSDLNGIAAVVRERLEPVLDLQRLFGETPDPHWLLDDGLHPSITGHQAIARAVVRRLSADR